MAPILLVHRLIPFILLAACSGSSFKEKSVRIDSDAVNQTNADQQPAANEFGTNPDGTPKIGPYAVSDQVALSKGIDLIIALDTSGSMAQEEEAIASNLSQMLLSMQKGSLDPRIHLISGSSNGGPGPGPAGRNRPNNPAPPVAASFNFPADINGSIVAQIDREVGSHDALGHVTALLAGRYANFYKDTKGVAMNPPLALRTGAKIEILIISDDNGRNQDGRESSGFSNLAADFDKEGKWMATVSGIIGLPTSAQAADLCEVAAIGQEYITLATKTGGSMLDICAKDWQALTERFSQDIVKRSISIKLSKTPVDPSKIVVTLDAKPLPAEAYSYNAAENRIYLAEGTSYAAGAVLGVNYDSQE